MQYERYVHYVRIPSRRYESDMRGVHRVLILTCRYEQCTSYKRDGRGYGSAKSEHAQSNAVGQHVTRWFLQMHERPALDAAEPTVQESEC